MAPSCRAPGRRTACAARPRRVPPSSAGPGSPACVRAAAVRGVRSRRAWDGPPPHRPCPADAVVTPQPPACPRAVAPRAGCVGRKPASLQRRGWAWGAGAPSARELGPGRRRLGVLLRTREGNHGRRFGSGAAERPARWLTGRDVRLASSCSLPCRPSTGVALHRSHRSSLFVSIDAADLSASRCDRPLSRPAPSAPALPTSGPSLSLLHPLFTSPSHEPASRFRLLSHPDAWGPWGSHSRIWSLPFPPHDSRASSPSPASLLSSRLARPSALSQAAACPDGIPSLSRRLCARVLPGQHKGSFWLRLSETRVRGQRVVKSLNISLKVSLPPLGRGSHTASLPTSTSLLFLT